jgi:signal transduction histidine kinase
VSTVSAVRRALGPGVRDALIAAALALGALGALLSDESRSGRLPEGPGIVLGVALALAATVPLAWRRRAPLEILGALGVANVLYAALGYPEGPAGLALLVALFGVASAYTARRSLIGFGIAAGAGEVLALVPDSAGQRAENGLFWIVLCIAAWSLGTQVRHRRLRRAAQEERDEQERRERELVAERRVAEERLRIARELHDVVAHGVSVMVVQAGAARSVLAADPERAEGALRTVEATGRHALAEMRRLLGVLREGTSGEATGTAPVPGVADVPELIRASEAGGVPTTLEVVGEPGEPPAAAGLTAYRIVQEALTNVRRHAGPGARATVRIVHREGEIEVTVEDDGAGPRGAIRPGHGLTGMRERAASLGGRIDVGPRPGGGMRVRARLPLVEAVVA